MFHLALLSAMPQEIGETKKHLRNIKEYKFGEIQVQGTLSGIIRKYI